MSATVIKGDKVGIKQGAVNAGSWGMVRETEDEEGLYLVAIEGDNDRLHRYLRTELRRWRSPNMSKSPETVSETSSKSSEGQLAQGQLPALRFDYTRLRALNGDRMFLEVTFNGKPYLVAIEGLTYGTVADYVANNKPEEVEYYEAQRQDKE